MFGVWGVGGGSRVLDDAFSTEHTSLYIVYWQVDMKWKLDRAFKEAVMAYFMTVLEFPCTDWGKSRITSSQVFLSGFEPTTTQNEAGLNDIST
jgi:hypothetical protein